MSIRLIWRQRGMFHVKLSRNLINQLIGQQSLNDEQVGKAEEFCGLLIDANRKINLISRVGDAEAEVQRQVLLSLTAIPQLTIQPSLKWIDIGSGGGFPAIPLAVFRPRDQFTLVESVAKKAFFLERTCMSLKLSNIDVINERIETVIENQEHKYLYNIMSIKAVARLSETFSWGGSLLGPQGRILTYKPELPSSDDERAAEREGFHLAGMSSIGSVCPDVTTKILIYQRI